jgi:uncharacterized protein (UPF0335 family)
MVRSCVVFETSAANFWVGMMGALRGPRPLDSTRHAKLCLRATLDEIEDAEHESKEEIAHLVTKIKKIQAGAKTKRVDVDAMKSLLLQCRKNRLKLSMLAKKKQALENHMETLDNSELNQHVLHSMQQTSHALKGMGLEKTLESVDRVMLDLEENHGDVSSIQNSLATSFDSVDDFDWEAEMEMLLDADSYSGDVGSRRTQTSVPTHVNTIAVGDASRRQLDLGVPEQLEMGVHAIDATHSIEEKVLVHTEMSEPMSEASVSMPLSV